ncbi:MAG: MarR family transcriptional regulator [Eubacterium sp.]
MNDEQRTILNTFFVDTFNKILMLEERTLSKSSIENLSVKELHTIEAVSMLQRDHKNTMTEIASQVGITVGALTTAINVLVKKEYLKRERSEDDRRVVRIYLTDKGMRAEMHHRIFHENMISNVGEILSEEGLDDLIKTLKQLTQFFTKEIETLN